MAFTPTFRPDPKPEPRAKRPRIPMKKVKLVAMLTPHQYLEKTADNLFSIYIRRRFANEYGMVNCFTCDAYNHWKHIDCGHFAPRGNHSTRWHLKNSHGQCKTCNGELRGNPKVYATNLDGKYGMGTADELGALSRLAQPWSENELRDLVQLLKLKIKQLG